MRRLGAIVVGAALVVAAGCGDDAKKLAALHKDLDKQIAEAQPDAKERKEILEALEEHRKKVVELRKQWEPPEDALIPALKNVGARAHSDAGGLTVETPTLGETLKVLAQGAPLSRPRSLVAAEGRAQLKLYAAPEVERPQKQLKPPDTPGVPPDLSLSIKELQELEAKLAKLRAAKREAAELETMKSAEQAHEAQLQKLKTGATFRNVYPLFLALSTAPSARLEIGLDRTVEGEVTLAEEEERDIFERFGLKLDGEGVEALKVSGTLAEKLAPAKRGKKKKRGRRRARRRR